MKEEQEHIQPNKEGKDDLEISDASSESLPVLESDYKSQSKEMERDIKIFIITLSVGIVIFLLFMGLGIFLTVYKSTLFGKIFLGISVFAIVTMIFNLVSVILFRKRFNFLTKASEESKTDIEILQEGESYEELLKSTESSLMNLGLYLIMTLIVIYAIFTVSCISFNSQVKSEVNVYANDLESWQGIYQKYSYGRIINFLSGFMIGLGILSLCSCAYLGYLFYLAFNILSFFHIYQKLVQFISMLFLQLGIAFLYLTVYSNRFKDLSIINPSLPDWIPVALLISSVIIILIAICGYVGATIKNTTWLISTCVLAGLFIAMFIVFSFCSVIAAHSLEKFSDSQCPAFVDYFNNNYIFSNNQCHKYTETSNDMKTLNCPKERIVREWETGMNDALQNGEGVIKENRYGCINMSCCYKMYNFVQNFMNYIALFCFCLIAFGLILIGTSFYLITLLEQKMSVGVEEKASQYFVYCFVGLITLFFIVLLSRMKTPQYSPNYSEIFISANPNNTEGIQSMFLPFSVQKENTTLLYKVFNDAKDQIKARSVLIEDFSRCSVGKCNVLEYTVEIISEKYQMRVNETLALKYDIRFKVSEDGLKVELVGNSPRLSFLYNDLIVFEKICQLEHKYASVKITGIGKKIDHMTTRIFLQVDRKLKKKLKEEPQVVEEVPAIEEPKTTKVTKEESKIVKEETVSEELKSKTTKTTKEEPKIVDEKTVTEEPKSKTTKTTKDTKEEPKTVKEVIVTEELKNTTDTEGKPKTKKTIKKTIKKTTTKTKIEPTTKATSLSEPVESDTNTESETEAESDIDSEEAIHQELKEQFGLTEQDQENKEEQKPLSEPLKISIKPLENSPLLYKTSSDFINEAESSSNKPSDITFIPPQTEIYELPNSNDGLNITELDMSRIKVGDTYTFFEDKYDFSLIDNTNTQSFTGTILTPSTDHVLSKSSNQMITLQYSNFPLCKREILYADEDGKFNIKSMPVLKNHLIHEAKLFFDNNELIKTILIGGIGFEKTVNLPSITLLQNNNDLVFSDENVQNSFNFTSYLIDSITLIPIENAVIKVFEGDVYFPNTQTFNNNTKISYQTMNSDKIVLTIHSNEAGLILIKDLLKEVYTLFIEKEGYYKEVIVINSKDSIQSIHLTPLLQKTDQYRIVLEWPRGPIDLNLFSYFQVSYTMQCEVFFGNRNCQHMTMNSQNYNNGTQGSQVITIESLGNYEYGFVVGIFEVNDDPLKRNEIKVKGADNEAPHWEYPQFKRKYTKEQKQMELSESQAKLSIYLPGYQMKVYSIQMKDILKKSTKESEQEWWLGFCFNGNLGISSLKTINQMTKDKPSFKMCEK